MGSACHAPIQPPPARPIHLGPSAGFTSGKVNGSPLDYLAHYCRTRRYSTPHLVTRLGVSTPSPQTSQAQLPALRFPGQPRAAGIIPNASPARPTIPTWWEAYPPQRTCHTPHVATPQARPRTLSSGSPAGLNRHRTASHPQPFYVPKPIHLPLHCPTPQLR